MLPKENRLSQDKDFKKIFRYGKLLRGKSLFIKKLAKSKTNPRIGIIVSTKVSKKATTRNKIKRRIRSIFRKIIETNDSLQDMVVVVNKEVLSKDFLKLKSEIFQILNYDC